ncbi:hypothetical protein KKA47_00230 [bacterium]|nr:hypothetical protein [bacterium]
MDAIPKIGELIDVAKVTTVVNLGDYEDQSRKKEIIEGFVFTDQVSRNLDLIGRSFGSGLGQGFFLIGNYGSGKSHFLSYLALAVSGGVSKHHDLDPIGRYLKGVILPVRVSLLGFRSTSRLEEAVLVNAQRAMDQLGVDVALAPERQILSYAADAARTESKKSPWDDHTDNEWQKLIKDDTAQALIVARKFLADRGLEKTVPYAAPAELLQRMLDYANRSGHAGIMLVIDELSEFFLSKPDYNLLNEDARYLQLLGEFSRDNPLWIVASLQEAIEKTGDISRDVIGKIKDRYPVRLHLNENHLKALISGRLIRKKEGGRQGIRQVWEGLKEQFSTFSLPVDEFEQIYPVHPDTISYLECLSPLFSQHRGIIDFVYNRLRGDERRGTTGMLDQPASCLLCVDQIFDHFEDRIRELDLTAPYYDLVYKQLNRTIDEIFADDEDRTLARKIIKILILTEVSAFRDKRTLAELTGMLLFPISTIDPRANYQYIKETILDRLARSSLYLRCDEAKNSLESRYYVKLEKDSRRLLEKEVERLANSIPLYDRRPVSYCLENLELTLPLKELSQGQELRTTINWRGTTRQGNMKLIDLKSLNRDMLEERRIHLAGSSSDFDIVVLFPDDDADADKRCQTMSADFSPDMLIWLPKIGKGHWLKIRNFYALSLIAGREGRSGEDTNIAHQAGRQLEQEKREVIRLIEDAYKNGRFYTAGSEAVPGPGSDAAHNPLERLIAGPVQGALEERFPLFRQIAPEIDFISRRRLTPLIEAILEPGRIGLAMAKQTNTRLVIEGVLMPMGLCRMSGSSFVMNLDPFGNPLIGKLSEMLKDGNIDFADARTHFIKGKYGLNEEMFEILILALVRAGHIELKKQGRRIPAKLVTFNNVSEAEQISYGELLEPKWHAALQLDEYLSQDIDWEHFSLVQQQIIWERLVKWQDAVLKKLAYILEKTHELSQLPAFDQFDFDRVRMLTKKVQAAADSVKTSKGSYHGLIAFLDGQPSLLTEIVGELGGLTDFFENHAEDYIRVSRYLKDVVVPKESKLAEQKQELLDTEQRIDELVFGGNINSHFLAFTEFQQSYIEAYCRAHSANMSEERFKPLKGIKAGPEFRCLELLSRIPHMSVVNTPLSIEKMLNETLSGHCRLSPAGQLKINPRCECGFKLGDSIEVADAGNITTLTKAGIDEYLNEILLPDNLERVIALIAAEKDNRPEDVNLLRDFVKRLKRGMTCEEAIDIISPRLIDLLKRAFSGRIEVVKRQLKDLSRLLIGRRLSLSKVRKIFSDWLGDLSGEDVYLEFSELGEDVGLADESELLDNSLPVLEGLDMDGLKSMLGKEDLKADEYSQVYQAIVKEGLAKADLWPIEITCPSKEISKFHNRVDCLMNSDEPPADTEKLLRWGSGLTADWSWIKETGSERLGLRQGLLSLLEDRFETRHNLFKNVLGDLPEGELPTFENLSARAESFSWFLIDGLRWDMWPILLDVINEKPGELHFVRSEKAKNTDGQREHLFGNSDVEVIKSLLGRKEGIWLGKQIYSERKEEINDLFSRFKVRVINFDGIDRLIHSTARPLCNVCEDVKKILKEELMPLIQLIPKDEMLIISSDHGFSQSPDWPRTKYRYTHRGKGLDDIIVGWGIWDGSNIVTIRS